MGTFWKNFINLIYPLCCVICNIKLSPVNEILLCSNCWNKIAFNLPPFCRRCGKHLKKQNPVLICINCRRSAYFFQQARFVCAYDGIVKKCIHLFKYKKRMVLSKLLNKLMIDFAQRYLAMQRIDLLIPVPLDSAKFRRRQFNQAAVLAAALAKGFGKEMKESLLVKFKASGEQVNLSRTKRLKNVEGTFKVRTAAPVKNKNILLVDDVFTTGATANECSRMLLQAGANRVEVLALAGGL